MAIDAEEVKQEIKNFLQDNMDLIKKGDLDTLYSKCPEAYRSDLTDFFSDSDIQPLRYMTEVPEYFYSHATGLKEVFIPRCIKRINKWAFSDCSSLTKLTVEDGTQQIGINAFKDCVKLESVSLPDSIQRIESYAFVNCIKAPLTIPSAVELIGSNAYYHTGIVEAVLPDRLGYVGAGIFNSCPSLRKVTIGKGIRVIHANTFYNCSALEEIVLPDNIEELWDSSFGYCTKLKSVSLGSGLKFIDKVVFLADSNLQGIDYRGTKEQWRAIRKHTRWRSGSALEVIHCTDGDIRLR